MQFTRNPDGIAGALYTIKQHADGSLLNNAHSEDLSHFCFGESVHYALSGLMATHPPLEAWIKAVDPKFIGRQDRADDAVGTPAVAVAPAGTSGFAGSATFATTLAAVAESVGRVTPEHVRFAQQLHRALPDELVTVLHQQDTVPQAIYALLLAAMNEGARRDGLDLLAVEDGVEAAQARRPTGVAVCRARRPYTPVNHQSVPASLEAPRSRTPQAGSSPPPAP